VHKPDGTPLDPNVQMQFECLQTTGNFCGGVGSVGSAGGIHLLVQLPPSQWHVPPIVQAALTLRAVN